MTETELFNMAKGDKNAYNKGKTNMVKPAGHHCCHIISKRHLKLVGVNKPNYKANVGKINLFACPVKVNLSEHKRIDGEYEKELTGAGEFDMARLESAGISQGTVVRNMQMKFEVACMGACSDPTFKVLKDAAKRVAVGQLGAPASDFQTLACPVRPSK
jgi:hypothetical protein